MWPMQDVAFVKEDGIPRTKRASPCMASTPSTTTMGERVMAISSDKRSLPVELVKREPSAEVQSGKARFDIGPEGLKQE